MYHELRKRGTSGIRALAVPAVLVAVGLAVLIGLGTWQLERKVWKEGLIAALQQRLSAPPVPLPPSEAWGGLTQSADEFRRVTLRAEFLHSLEVTAYAVGSALRSDVSGPGDWVFTPARLPGGTLVVVDRGFVPEAGRGPAGRSERQVHGTIDLVGVLRWPEPVGWFTPAADRSRRRWFVRDHLDMAAAMGWGRVAPFYLALEGPMPPGGLPKPGRLTPHLRNEHLQYALTWFGLAIVLAAVFGIWAVGRWRATEPRSGS